jgi:hypothetical protein
VPELQVVPEQRALEQVLVLAWAEWELQQGQARPVVSVRRLPVELVVRQALVLAPPAPPAWRRVQPVSSLLELVPGHEGQ